jgi:hypothetical protein
VADSSTHPNKAFDVPKSGDFEGSPALSNQRQDSVFDTTNGFFNADPPGLWIIVSSAIPLRSLMAPKNGTDLERECESFFHPLASAWILSRTSLLNTPSSL